MSRFANPTPQFLDGAGYPLASGLMYFYESGSNVAKNTYADSDETILNTNPVLLSSAGRLPNVFFTGTARVVLKDSDNVEIWDKDPVGGVNEQSNFSLWQDFIIYDKNNFVEYDNNFYISNVNDNQGNIPSSSPENNINWTQVSFLETYNSTTSYSINDISYDSGSLWRSVVSPNLANKPSTDNGDNWLPAVAGDKIPEIINLTESVSTVIPHTGGGTLTAKRINELRDSSSYILPLANSVDENEIITITLPERYIANSPTVVRAGGDTITGSAGADTSILFSAPAEIKLTSDGVSNWSL